MSIRLTFEIEFHSDYHISAGQRAGMTVDSALLRDYDQLPVLRGTTLVGLLRDGLRDLQDLLKSKQTIPLQYSIDDSCERLFGHAQKRKRWAFSSARPVMAEQDKVRWGSQDTARVRINPRTRRADPQKLFFQEEGSAELRFRFTARCPAATAVNRRDAALLIGAARMVRHLGAARRRGRGHCSLHLVDAEGLGSPPSSTKWTTESGLQWFKQMWLQPSTDLLVEAESAVLQPQAITLSGEYKRLRFIVQLLEPVLVARRLQATNTIESLPVIPGTAVLGALATQAAYQLGLQDKIDPPDEFIQLFLRGGIQVSMLFPAQKIGSYPTTKLVPAIPAPRALFQCENYPAYTSTSGNAQTVHPVHDALNGRLPEGCQQQLPSEQICSGKLKEVDGFVLLQNGRQNTYTPERRKEMHIRLDRQTGRVEEGVLYEYIALEAGQWFVGEIRCDKSAWERVGELTGLAVDLRLTMRLGKAAQRGYGLVHYVLEDLSDDVPNTLILTPLNQRVMVQANNLDVSILLLSDTIIADTWGGFYRGFDPVWLSKVFSTPDLPIPATAITITENRQFTSSRHVDAFHTYRRMSRWRDEAIEAGSVVQLRITLPNNADQQTFLRHLANLEITGIGLRQHEGFGRIAFNHPILMDKPAYAQSIKLQAAFDLLHPTQSEAHQIQKLLQFRQDWRKELEEQKWDRKMSPDFETAARLLFLYRYRSAAELKQWLAQTEKGEPQTLLQASNLWQGQAKQLAAGEKEPRLDKDGLTFINEMITLLESHVSTKGEAVWAVGLEILAERIADEATQSRGGGGS